MTNITPRHVLLFWITGLSSLLMLAGGSTLYPLGRPILADRPPLEDVLLLALLGAALGALLGAGQSFLLRQGRGPSLVFVAYTSLGMAAGWVLWSVTSAALVPFLRTRFDVLAPPVNYASAALMGAALAISQGSALNREGEDGRVWAVLTALGWFLAWAVCAGISTVLLPDASSPISSAVAGLVFGLIYSSTTAIAVYSRERRQTYLAA